MTNSTMFQENWDKQKEKLKQRYEQLTDNDLHFEEGEIEKKYKNLEVKLGKTKEELSQILKEL